MVEMDNGGQRTVEKKLVNGKSQIDTEAVVEQIWNDLNGTISRSDIREVISEISLIYNDVRITTYVPIFLRRDVLRHFLQDKKIMDAESKKQG